MYMDKESENLKWRDLTGPEKLMLFKSIKIPELFPNLQEVQKVQQLWEEFKNIYVILWCGKKLDDLEIRDFTTKVKYWMTSFTSVY